VTRLKILTVAVHIFWVRQQVTRTRWEKQLSYNLYGHKHERGILKLEGRYEKGTAVTPRHMYAIW